MASIQTDPTLGDFLRCTFDRAASTTNECHLSVGDSSGALFIQDGGVWKLAGIHYSVDSGFSTDGTPATEFIAAMLDLRGIYVYDGTNWNQIPTNLPSAVPSAFYSTRVSAHLGRLNSVINFQPGADLRITAVTRTNGDMQIDFATGTNRLYRLDCTDDIATGLWTNITNNLLGNGGIMSITDPAAAGLPQRFYRLRLNP